MTDGIDGLAMSRREDETWQVIGAFPIVCGMLTAVVIMVLNHSSTRRSSVPVSFNLILDDFFTSLFRQPRKIFYAALMGGR